MNKICIVTTVYTSIRNWIEPLLPTYLENNFDITIITNFSDENYLEDVKKKYPDIKFVNHPFHRGIKLRSMLKSMKFLEKYFKENNFDLVQYSTPNASFCASYAAKKAKIKHRIYCQWGMVFSSRKNITREVFKSIEKLICRWSTVIQPDSKGNLEYCRKSKIYSEEKSNVVWNGSAKGLDLTKYNIDNKEQNALEIKERHNIPNNALILGFVGRLGKEKGCNELFKAFRTLEKENSNLYLLFVGPIEKEKTIEPELLKYFFDSKKIIITNRVPDVEKYIAAMDIFVLPSYREGFGMSVIEASALEVPVICTKYPGPSNAMVDGLTGLSINIRDTNDLIAKIQTLIKDPELRSTLGKNGRIFVTENFDQKIFLQKLIENRLNILNK